ncbi:MAG TPA: ABC transporter permease [Actinobacteria bacterium]|nr:ABC transporter permease [Actinomycetota bacterium]
MIYKRYTTRAIILFMVVGIMSLVALFPFYWMIISSFRTNAEIFSTQLNLIPDSFIFKNYIDLITTTNFSRWILNSIIIAVSTTILGLFFSVFAGYAFAKYNFFAKNTLFIIVFLMMAVPRFVTVIPIFKLMSSLGLTNNYFALILPFAINPFAVFLMRQYIKNIPEDLLDSARIDGCNELQIVINIIMPIIKPSIGAAGIFILMMSWNDYLFPLILMTKENMMLFPVGLASLKTLYVVEYGMIMSGSFLSVLPLIIAFLLLQRQFIAGLTEGAVKG